MAKNKNIFEKNFWIVRNFVHLRHERNKRNKKRFIINYLYENYDKKEGFLRSSSYAKLQKCSTDTALRDLKDLIKKEMLKAEDNGKKTNYLINSPTNIRIPRIETENANT